MSMFQIKKKSKKLIITTMLFMFQQNCMNIRTTKPPLTLLVN